jgi:PI31 proteasome regulator N-terminal
MSRNPLDLSALTTILPTLLPPSSKALNSPQDALAALLHTAMIAVGYRLIGVDNSLVSRQDLHNVLPEEWAQKGPGYYTFRYKHEQSSLEFVVTVSMLGNDRIVVNAVALEVCSLRMLLYMTPLTRNRVTKPSLSTFLPKISSHRPFHVISVLPMLHLRPSFQINSPILYIKSKSKLFKNSPLVYTRKVMSSNQRITRQLRQAQKLPSHRDLNELLHHMPLIFLTVFLTIHTFLLRILFRLVVATSSLSHKIRLLHRRCFLLTEAMVCL